MLDQMHKNAKVFFFAAIFSLIVGVVMYLLLSNGITVNPIVFILVIMFILLILKPLVNAIKGVNRKDGK